MTGKHKGVASSILKKNPDIFISNCCCHLMHLAAKNGKLFFNFILFFPSAVLMIDARAMCIIFRHTFFQPYSKCSCKWICYCFDLMLLLYLYAILDLVAYHQCLLKCLCVIFFSVLGTKIMFFFLITYP